MTCLVKHIMTNRSHGIVHNEGQKKSLVHASYIRGEQCFENEERHHVFKALSNTEAEDIVCVQRKQCQLLARHLDGRIFHSNASKELALLQLTDATNVQPCIAGTPKKKTNAAALPGFKNRPAFGLSRRMQVHTTSS